MTDEHVLLVTGQQVEAALAGRHKAAVEVIRDAYIAHAGGGDVLPAASILRFPDRPRDRIIALPAYVGGETPVAGVKWISSFPANTDVGRERASAVILMNSLHTGRVTAVVEGSVISATRTAASAALAATAMYRGPAPGVLGLIGCGRINYEVLRFILAVGPAIGSVLVHDASRERADAFAERCTEVAPDVPVVRVEAVGDVLAAAPLVSFATTALTPHVADLSMCPPAATILHVSLRDLAPDAILAADNVVDDVEHVCTAQTSVHLAEQAVGHRRFIRATLGDVLLGNAAARADDDRPVVFSPFGLGTLDVALAGAVLSTVGDDAVPVEGFWPQQWQAGAR
jgi:ornithine cyclodeaminase